MDPDPQRQAALHVVRTLRAAGHEAWWVGGCVRDELLGLTPHEYDIATDAPPERVQEVFPRNVAVGKQFGVIVALVGKIPIEVATFRSDDAYIDGRRPTGVRFTGAREDAERRDFTVNALYLDPETGRIVDHVGGRADLAAGVLRAIGDPRARFAEDRLRMLRAVRFAATRPLEIEADTWAAVCEMSGDVGSVSWERIREELSKILVSGNAERGFRLLDESGLLPVVLPEIAALHGVEQPPLYHPEGDVWVHTQLVLGALDALPDRPLVLALAALLHDIGKPATFTETDRIRFNGHDRLGARMADDVLRRLRYPNAIVDDVRSLIERHIDIGRIGVWRPAKRRRFLLAPLAPLHLELHRLDCLGAHRDLSVYEACVEERAALLAEPALPPPVITGHDLLAAGYRPGPWIGKVLAEIDDERLEGRLTTQEEALAWALQNHPPTRTPTAPSPETEAPPQQGDAP